MRTSYRGIWVAHSAAQKHATRACKQRIISVGLEDGLVEDFLEKEICSKVNLILKFDHASFTSDFTL